MDDLKADPTPDVKSSRTVNSPRAVTIFACAALVLAVYWPLDIVFHGAARQPDAVLAAPSIFAAAATESSGFLAGLVATCVLFALGPTRTWLALPGGLRLLWLPAIAVIASLTWHLATLDFNFALMRSYSVDRIILTVVAAAAAVHPAFLPAFVVCGHAFTSQLNVPPLYFNWTDTQVLYQVAVAISVATASISYRCERRTVPPASAWGVVLGVFGSWYLLSAVGKAQLGWLWANDLSRLLRAAREQHGWLAWLGPENFEAVALAVDRFAGPMQLSALVIEAVVLLYFFSRWTTVLIPLSCISLHAMIFATTGILFWKWSLVDLSVAVAFVSIGPGRWKLYFPRAATMAVCIAVLLLHGKYGPRVTKLAWYDSPFVYRFQFVGEGESGRSYEVMPDAFAPFDSRFAQSRWFFLTERPRLVDCFGSIHNPDAYAALLAADNPEQVGQIVERFGVPLKDGEKIEQFARLMQAFLSWTSTREDIDYDFGIWKAPLHITTGTPPGIEDPVYRFQEPLESLEVILIERQLFDDEYETVSTRPVFNVDRPDREPDLRP